MLSRILGRFTAKPMIADCLSTDNIVGGCYILFLFPIPVGIAALPSPTISAHFINAESCLPVKLFFGLTRISITCRNVPSTPR
eukprot:m.490332 g.490332  ORF g.490332 m.490332 type:complete len:83 (-) comp21776_c0_seq12:1184-1432(-)